MSIESLYSIEVKSLIRIIIFQALWFLFAYWGKWPIQYLAPLVALVFVLIDWKMAKCEISLKGVLGFIGFILICGIIIDSLLYTFGVIEFDHSISWSINSLSTMNMWAIWIIFVPYYDFAFEKFEKSTWLSIIFALFGAPIAYKGGAQLSGFLINKNGLYFIAIAWAIFFPTSIKIYYGFFKKCLRKNLGNEEI